MYVGGSIVSIAALQERPEFKVQTPLGPFSVRFACGFSLFLSIFEDIHVRVISSGFHSKSIDMHTRTQKHTKQTF